MTVQDTAASHSPSNPLSAIGTRLVRFLDRIAQNSDAMACSRKAQRLMALTDAELAARGLTRDRIVEHAFAYHMAY